MGLKWESGGDGMVVGFGWRDRKFWGAESGMVVVMGWWWWGDDTGRIPLPLRLPSRHFVSPLNPGW